MNNSKTEAAAMAENTMSVSDLHFAEAEAEALSADEVIRRRYDVDSTDYTDEQALIEAVRETRKRNGDPSNTSGTSDVPETDENAESAPQRLPGGAGSRRPRTDVEALSESAMTVSDWREVDRTETSPRMYVHRTYGVDPADYRTERASAGDLSTGGTPMSTSETYSRDDEPDPDAPADPSVPEEGFDAVVDRLSLGIDDPQARVRSRQAVGDAYDYLAAFGTASERDLRWFYDPYIHAQPANGRYDTRREWWDEVGRDALLSLPGVAESGDGRLVFTGVDSRVGETIPASEFEPADEIRAVRVLNGVEFRKMGRRDALRNTWEFLRDVGELSESAVIDQLSDHEQLTRRSAEYFWDDTARETLAELPGVSVSREGGMPDPTEIQVETLAAVIDGLREVGVDLEVTHNEGSEVWRARS